MYSVVEDKVTKRMAVSDLIRIPVHPKSDKPKRKQPKKVPSLYLTSDESLAYIEESNKKTEEKQRKTEEEDNVKHKAVCAHRKQKRDANKNVKKTVLVLPKKQVRHTGAKVSRLTTQSKRDNPLLFVMQK